MSEEIEEGIKGAICEIIGSYLVVSGILTLFVAFTNYSDFPFLIVYSFILCFIGYFTAHKSTPALILSFPLLVSQLFVFESYLKVIALVVLFIVGFSFVIEAVEKVAEAIKPYNFVRKK